MVEGSHAWVGFSRLRPTKLYENLRWWRRQLSARGDEPTAVLPTRIARYDLVRGVLLDEIDLEPAGLGAVFSILPHDTQPTRLGHQHDLRVSAG